MGKTLAELNEQTGRFRVVEDHDHEHGEGWKIVDTATGVDVGWDGDVYEEDQSLVRGWFWVVEALNKVNAERRNPCPACTAALQVAEVISFACEAETSIEFDRQLRITARVKTFDGTAHSKSCPNQVRP